MEQKQLLRLVEQAAAGDTAAFEAICQQKAKDVLYICTHLMGNLPDGEDAAQEVFLAMQTSILRLKNPQAFTAWSNRLIANICKSMQRTKNRGGSQPLEELALELEEMQLEFLPQDFAEEREKRQVVLSAMYTLPFRYRAALVLFYYEGATTKDIATALDTNVKGAENLLHRARKSLRREIEKKTGQSMPVGSVATNLGGALVLTRILNLDSLATVTEESIARVAAAGAVAGGAITTVAAAAGGAGAAGAAQSFLGWAAVVAASVLATTGIAIASTRVSSLPPSVSVVDPPAPTETELVGAGPSYSFTEAQSSSSATSGTDGGVADASSGLSGGASSWVHSSSSRGESGGEAGTGGLADTFTTYTGQFQFAGPGGALLPAYNGVAKGFRVSVYSGDAYLGSTTADESGAFSLTLQNVPAGLRAEVDALHGYGPAAGTSFTFSFAAADTVLPAITFTDTQQPAATVHFYNAAGTRQEGDVNPAEARITIYDATGTDVSWHILDAAGTLLQSGSGTTASLSALPQGRAVAQYSLVVVLTDAAGNIATTEREFVTVYIG